MQYMLDTDISSYVIRRSHPEVLDRLRGTLPGDVLVSAITRGELLYGVAVSPRQVRDQLAVEDFLRHVTVMDFPAEAAADYAEIRAQLKVTGQMIGSNDLWIAAHARHLQVTLVTNNAREFGRVVGLKTENWAELPRSNW